MTISNLTRGTIVAGEVVQSRSFVQRLVGLMGKASLQPSAGMLIDQTNWIHTFWMRFPLDVIYIDRKHKVVGLESGIAPNRIGKPFWSAHAVIELNAGIIRSSGTQVGDQLQVDS